MALQAKAAAPFRVPRAIELIPINAVDGRRAIFGEKDVILEAFKPGDEPPVATSVIGQTTKTTSSEGDGLVLVAPGKIAPSTSETDTNSDAGLTDAGDGLY